MGKEIRLKRSDLEKLRSVFNQLAQIGAILEDPYIEFLNYGRASAYRELLNTHREQEFTVTDDYLKQMAKSCEKSEEFEECEKEDDEMAAFYHGKYVSYDCLRVYEGSHLEQEKEYYLNAIR